MCRAFNIGHQTLKSLFGLAISATEVFTFAPENLLHDLNTLIWFQDRVPKSTPTNSNPFNSASTYVGTLDVHISHVLQDRRDNSLTVKSTRSSRAARRAAAGDTDTAIIGGKHRDVCFGNTERGNRHRFYSLAESKLE